MPALLESPNGQGSGTAAVVRKTDSDDPQPFFESEDLLREASSPKVASSPRSSKKREKSDKDQWKSTRYQNEGLPPWIGPDGETVIWPAFRVAMAKIVMSQFFERLMGLIIVFNLALIWVETDKEAQCYPQYEKASVQKCPTAGGNIMWIFIVNRVLLGIYTLELFARLYVERLQYFKTGWNRLDFFVVASGWFGEIFAGMINVAFLRIFRVSRLSRVVRIILAIKELYMLVMGMVSAMKAIFWGALMIFFLLAFFSILLVEFVHPVNSKLDYGSCERCPRAYASVIGSSLTLFQHVVAGDSWGSTSVMAIESDSTPLSAVLLVSVMIVISLGFMNLILAVIVASAEEGRENDIKKRLEDAAAEKEAQAQKLLALCAQADKDGSGTLSLSEMYHAYDNLESFRSMFQMMDIRRDEIYSIYRMLDTNDDGEIDYDEFCENVYRLKTDDVRKFVSETKYISNETNNMVRRAVKQIESHGNMLHAHEELLVSINQKLDGLSRTSPNAVKEPVVNNASTQPFVSTHFLGNIGTFLTGMSRNGSAMNSERDENSFDEALRNIAQISSWLQDEVARQAGDAAAALLQHAEVLVAASPGMTSELAASRVQESIADIRASRGGAGSDRRSGSRFSGPLLATVGFSPDIAIGDPVGDRTVHNNRESTATTRRSPDIAFSDPSGAVHSQL